MDIVVQLTNGQFGILEDAQSLELEGEQVECWVEGRDGFELKSGFVADVV
jgi:hypothetical protein